MSQAVREAVTEAEAELEETLATREAAVREEAIATPDGRAKNQLLSKKPFYVYFRILHAYTIIYLKYRVYC